MLVQESHWISGEKILGDTDPMISGNESPVFLTTNTPEKLGVLDLSRVDKGDK